MRRLQSAASRKESRPPHFRWNPLYRSLLRGPQVLLALFLLILTAISFHGENVPGSIALEIDATEAPKKIIHSHLVVPVHPGPLTLYYPKWIPGDHAPDGPIANLAGIHFDCEGKHLTWRRDLIDMYAFHIEIPAGAKTLDVHLDYLISPPSPGASSGTSADAQLLVLNWEDLLLYPEDPAPIQLMYRLTVQLPPSWRFGTALPIEKQSGSTIVFTEVSLGELVDSPLLAGLHFRNYPLTPEKDPAHEIDVAAEGDADLVISPATLSRFQHLVREAGILYGSHPYRGYHFLLTLSDEVPHFGLEHRESSDDRVAEQTFEDRALFLTQANLLPHEFTHAWNGKFRRPADLTTSSFEQPMKGDLLWVYEGLTQFLGDVLTARSGLWSPEQYREQLAYVAATIDHRAGRNWRSLQDTADAVQIFATIPNDQILSSAAYDWTSLRRSTDYYEEGELLWLEVDATLRKLTNDSRSLDDFCERFFASENGNASQVKTYDFDDVVLALNELAPWDWRSFLRERLDATDSRLPSEAIENAGWRLIYNGDHNRIQDASETVGKKVDLTFSIGAVLDSDGMFRDVIPGMAAIRSGLGPQMKVRTINHKKWSPDAMRMAIEKSRGSARPIELEIEYGKTVRTYRIDYHGGARYPHLERLPNQPNRLDEMISARSAK